MANTAAWTVIDASVLRGTSLSSFPRAGRWLVPRRLLDELVSSRRPDAPHAFKRLLQIFADPAFEIAVSHFFQRLLLEEFTSGAPTDRNDLVDKDDSAFFASVYQQGGMRRLWRVLQPGAVQVEVRAAEYLTGLRESADLVPIDEQHRRSFGSDLQADRSVVADLALRQHIAFLAADPKVPDWELKDAEQTFESLPETSVLHVMTRCMVYQQLGLSSRAQRKIRNDYDDLEYAALASQAGRLATRDRGLTRMVGVCAPWVQCEQL